MLYAQSFLGLGMSGGIFIHQHIIGNDSTFTNVCNSCHILSVFFLKVLFFYERFFSYGLLHCILLYDLLTSVEGTHRRSEKFHCVGELCCCLMWWWPF